MVSEKFIIYLVIMAGVTYLVRLLPMLLVRKKITNRFIYSFLHYVPYAVLTAMTFPAVFYATGSLISATVGVVVALLVILLGRGMILTSLLSCVSVLVTEVILMLFK